VEQITAEADLRGLLASDLDHLSRCPERGTPRRLDVGAIDPLGSPRGRC
jgi:hypothetical protein